MENQVIDKKALSEMYVASYNYTTTQRVVAIIAIVIVLCGTIALGTFVTLSIIDFFTK
jgi:uncharacterized membrane-anchored protein